MENKVAVCGANSINAITDVIHDYYCGKGDRLSIQLRVQDAIDQLNSVRQVLISEDGELYVPSNRNKNGK